MKTPATPTPASLLFDVIALTLTLILYTGGVILAPFWIQLLGRVLAG